MSIGHPLRTAPRLPNPSGFPSRIGVRGRPHGNDVSFAIVSRREEVRRDGQAETMQVYDRWHALSISFAKVQHDQKSVAVYCSLLKWIAG